MTRVAMLFESGALWDIEKTINAWLLENSIDELHDIMLKKVPWSPSTLIVIVYTNHQQESDEYDEKEAQEEKERAQRQAAAKAQEAAQ